MCNSCLVTGSKFVSFGQTEFDFTNDIVNSEIDRLKSSCRESIFQAKMFEFVHGSLPPKGHEVENMFTVEMAALQKLMGFYPSLKFMMDCMSEFKVLVSNE